MRARTAAVGVLAAVALVGGAAAFVTVGRRPPPVEHSTAAARQPRMRPEYSGTVVPPNIAPLNFRLLEHGVRFVARITGRHGEPIECASRTGTVTFPRASWGELLQANRGERITIAVYAQEQDGRWTRFEDCHFTVAREPIDRFLVYRRIGADHNIWTGMSIRQRDLSTYEDTCVVNNELFGYGCINCHAFHSNGTSRFLMHVRPGREEGGRGSGMLLATENGVAMADTRSAYNPKPGAYASWHPDGRVIAFSINRVTQFFHTRRSEVREVIDLASDIAVYDVGADRVTSTPRIATREAMETYPCWSHDGRYLYFSSAPVLWGDDPPIPPERYSEVRYSLMRIPYDAATGEWGEVEPVLAATDAEASLTQPRCSPDGRFVALCATHHGCFPVFHEESDLYLLELESGDVRRMECNSDRTDSWHSWSSNGRWLIFSSKRLDGLFARPFVAYIAQDGTASPPFELPQRDPAFHDSLLKSYNVPELVTEPVGVRGEELARVIRAPESVPAPMPTTAATPQGGMNSEEDFDPWSPGKPQ